METGGGEALAFQHPEQDGVAEEAGSTEALWWKVIP